ncbi:MAG: SDR family oxidoreductase [Faecalibacterium sp.]
MQRILVTGAGGFMGARILHQWKGKAELLRFPEGFLTQAGEAQICAQVQALAPDGIVHTAAISDTGYCEGHPERSHRANVELTLWLAQAAKQISAKLVCISSDQVYAGVTQPGPLPETLDLHPANVYGRHKLEAEQRTLELLPEAVFLRASWMYDLPGYGLPIRGNLLLNLVRAALRGQTLTFSSREYRGVTYVRQAVELLLPALALPGGVYNFGSENELDMLRTAKCFADTLGITVMLGSSDRQRNLSMDCARLHEAGICFDTTEQGLCRCLQDYGLIERI